jgi:hypothetical protein
MLEPNEQIHQAYLLDATPAFSSFLLVSTLDSSSTEPFSFGFSSSQVGATVLPARCIHALVLLDQPTLDQHVFSDFIYFLRADRH